VRLTLGSFLGPYEIVAPLGAGGMGEVYRGRDSRLGRDVALKVISDKLSHDTDRIRRFSSGNSLVGSAASTDLRSAVDDPVNGTFISPFLAEGGGRVRVGQTSTVSVPDAPVATLTFSLSGPQPNPARSEFRYAVTLPEAMRVRVDLYDVAGRRVRQLVDQHLPAGYHGLEWRRGSAALGPGLYFLRLQGAGANAVRGIVLLE
jgi:hypothetical protein